VNKRDEGFSSIEFLVALVFLSVCALAAGYMVKAAGLAARRRTEVENVRLQINKILDEAAADLKADPTPQSDSRFDAFWQWNGKTESGCSVKLRSLSSSLNPNFLRTGIYEKTELATLFLTGKNAQQLLQYREDNGLLFTGSDCKDFFSEETYNTYFSVYSWANINIIDEFAVRQLAASLTGNESDGEMFRQKVRTLLTGKQIMQTEDEFKMFCGISYDKIYPYINTEPVMNVQFVEPLVLKSVLSYPDYNLAGAVQKTKQLLALRESRELTEDDIVNVLGIDKTNRLYYFFGTITWFWQIEVQNGTIVCNEIICRMPSETMNSQAPAEWYLVEKKWK
jgi:hypothetical protein